MTINVTVLGTRGIPDVQGGVETHCQNLYPEIYRQWQRGSLRDRPLAVCELPPQ